MTAKRRSKKSKRKRSPPPAAEPKSLNRDPREELKAAFTGAVVSMNGAINISAAALTRRMDEGFARLERLLGDPKCPRS
jgi:hypothetical protein